MDRFIDDTATEVNINSMYLKSNMDRFIDYTYYCINELENVFKIQYG